MAKSIGEFECAPKDCYTDMNGNAVISFISEDVRTVKKVYADAINSVRDGKKRLKITISEYKERRSLDANAYFHVLVGEIAKITRQSADEVKRRLVFDYGTPREEDGEPVIIAMSQAVKEPTKHFEYPKWLGNFTTSKGKAFAQYLIYKRTSELDTAEMSRLIDGAVTEAKELGIDTRTPEEIELMKQRWASAPKSN